MWNPFDFWKPKPYNLLPRPGDPRQEPEDRTQVAFWIGVIVGTVVTLVWWVL